MERRRGRWRPADRDGERHRAHKDNRRVWWCGVWHFPLVSCLSSYGEHHCESEFHRADLLFGNLLHGCSKLHARWFREFDGKRDGWNEQHHAKPHEHMDDLLRGKRKHRELDGNEHSYWFCPARQFGGVRRYVYGGFKRYDCERICVQAGIHFLGLHGLRHRIRDAYPICRRSRWTTESRLSIRGKSETNWQRYFSMKSFLILFGISPCHFAPIVSWDPRHHYCSECDKRIR